MIFAKKTFSIRFIVALTISLLIIVMAVLFIYQSYSTMKKNIMSATEVMAKYVTDAINQSITKSLAPSEVILKLLKSAEITESKTLEDRIHNLMPLAQALEANPISDSIFIGYENGEFLSLRHKKDNFHDSKVHVPENAYYILTAKVLLGNGSFQWSFLFFDKNLDLIERVKARPYKFDPKQSSWYKLAKSTESTAASRAYIFFDTNEVGFSLSELSENKNAVIGLDITTKDLSNLLEELKITPGSKMVIIDETDEVMAYPGLSSLSNKKVGPDGSFELTSLGVPIFNQMLASKPKNNSIKFYSENGKKWYGISSQLNAFYGNGLKIFIGIPLEELLGDLWHSLMKEVLFASITALLVLIGGWILGNRLVQPLLTLTKQVSNNLNGLELDKSIGINTRIKEVKKLGDVLNTMAHTIGGFSEISRSLNRETNLELMLTSVLKQLLNIVKLEEGAIYLNDGKGKLKLSSFIGGDYIDELLMPSDETRDAKIIEFLHRSLGLKNLCSLLKNRDNELIGVLCVTCSDCGNPGNLHKKISLGKIVQQISTSAAVAIETRKLVYTQKTLLNGMIKLIADAIDTKSRYTGGHCKRVPELALMIVDELKNTTEEPFANFTLNKQQEEEFRIAAWMHDCGKITTPEYVVDKATKLETIYNRIHEVRNRFEILYRDAEITGLKEIIGGADKKEVFEKIESQQKILQEEFAFVAKCNIGAESMDQEDIDRLLEISNRVWIRNFDNTLGLSRDEYQRYLNAGEIGKTPSEEFLLADKKCYIVPWQEPLPPVQEGDPQNIWGFKMKLPENMYNYGELYNLSIYRGTLTAEERFKINDHIVQTICMLSSLPFPAAMSRVPDIAGNHHETLDGTGYPRKLNSEQMPITDRIMAIADVFEALTASDRPYKDGKTLTKSLAILSRMVKEGHLDKDIFNFFLRNKLYIKYANIYLKPEQIDEVDINDYLA